MADGRGQLGHRLKMPRFPMRSDKLVTDDKINFIYLQVVSLLLLRQRRRLPHEHGRHHRQPVSLENG